MNNSSIRPAICRSALIALGCAFSLALIPTAAVKAADTVALQPLATVAPSLPLTATFEKVTGAEKGPFVLKLKNDSKNTIKASAKILLAVAFHSESKARNLPEHAIDAGQVWTIPDLVAQDKVTITANGFAPLELTVH
jgi:hypothetical protein